MLICSLCVMPSDARAAAFELAQVLLGAHSYFWVSLGTFGGTRVILGTRGCFWSRTGTFGRAQVLLGARR